jgi:hypothetical protein
VGGFTIAAAEENAALLTAAAALLSAIATVLYYTTELRFRRGSSGRARAGPPPDESPPDEPTDSGGQAAGPPAGLSGGGAAAAPPPPLPLQTWTGTVRRVTTTGLLHRIPPRPGPAWWAQHAVTPANGWTGNVRSGPRQSPPAPTEPVSGRPMPWWRNVQGRQASEGGRERSST